MKLKPKVSYRFSASDRDIIYELCKIGSVRILSEQVELTGERLQFGDIGECDGLVLPNNWAVEAVYHREKEAQILFKVKEVREAQTTGQQAQP